MNPTIGRIVHYILDDGQHRPAIIVRVWEDGRVQLQVFTDGSNDGAPFASGIVWRTSVHEGTESGSWHWPERE